MLFAFDDFEIGSSRGFDARRGDALAALFVVGGLISRTERELDIGARCRETVRDGEVLRIVMAAGLSCRRRLGLTARRSDSCRCERATCLERFE